MKKPKSPAPTRYVLHTFDRKTLRLVDKTFETERERDLAWWRYAQRNKGASAYRTRTGRSA